MTTFDKREQGFEAKFISLWFERRNTFKERAVVEGMLAISTKLGGPSRPFPPIT